MTSPARPRFFATPAAWRAWLAKHHASAIELLVGFYKQGSGKPSITWPESVDAALCFGWIDGVRRTIDEERYTIRFTPRAPRSTWSAVNINRVAALTELGLMHAAGLATFAARKAERSGVYSYEQRHTAALDAEQESRFRSNTRAWDFFSAQPPWYRRTAIYWIVSAKRDETRRKRLDTLIADSERERTIARLTRPSAAKRKAPARRVDRRGPG